MKIKIDLHTHSIYSDGSLTPIELIEEANSRNISIMSITDHDSLNAYKEMDGNAPKIFKEAKNKGIDLIPGIELSVNYSRNELHILGYYFDTTDKLMHQLLEKQKKLAIEGIDEICKKFQKAEFTIDFKKIKENAFPAGRYYLALDIISNSDNKELLNNLALDPKNPVDDIIYRIIPKNFSFEFPTISIDETIRVIKNAGGVVVLAHPTESFPIGVWSERKAKIEEIVKELIAFGLDGIETAHSKYSKDEQKFLDGIAKKYNLLRSGGSDFHGEAMPKVNLGDVAGFLDVSHIMQLKEKSLSRKHP